jgi:hypothetical protein
MTDEEIAIQRRDALLEWQTICADPDLYRNHWRLWNSSKVLGAQPLPAPTWEGGEVVPCEAPPPFLSVWGASKDASRLIDTSAILATKPNCTRAQCDCELVVKPEAVPDRMSTILGGWGKHVHGCYASRKNVCRYHVLSPPYRDAVNRITDTTNRYIDARGKAAVDSCTEVIHFTGTDTAGEAEPLHAWVLVTLAVYSPKMQYVARLFPSAGCPVDLFLRGPPPEFPFVLEIGVRTQRWGWDDPAAIVLDIMTSDELAWAMSRRGLHIMWQMQEVATAIVCDVPHLLDMLAVGEDASFSCAVNKRKRQSGAAHDLDEIFFAPAANAAEDALQAMGRNPDLVPNHESDSEFDDLGSDQVEDIMGNIEELSYPAVPPPDSDVELESSGDDDPACAIDALARVCVDGGPRLGDPPDRAATAVRNASVTIDGYVTCSSEPWAAFGTVGRVVRWPVGAPPEIQRVTVTCYCHGKCNLLRSGRRLTMAEAYHWLFRAEWEPGWSGFRKDELRNAHQAMRAEYPLLAAQVAALPDPPTPAAGSSDGAAGSAAPTTKHTLSPFIATIIKLTSPSLSSFWLQALWLKDYGAAGCGSADMATWRVHVPNHRPKKQRGGSTCPTIVPRNSVEGPRAQPSSQLLA